MRKNFKKALSLVLAGLLAVGGVATLSACNNGKEEAPDNAESIQLAYWKSGYGIEWLNQLVEKFETAYPQYKVYIEDYSSSDIFSSTIKMKNDNTIDLYMMSVKTDAWKEYLEPLDTEVLDYQWNGESKTIRQKINPTVLQGLETSDGKIYSVMQGDY